MFLAAAFSKKFQLADNDILGRSDPENRFVKRDLLPVRESPSRQRVGASNVNIGLKTGIMMDQLK
jgi:hypothetical protein